MVLAECERRQKVFDAAAQIFIANGYAASTMESIAARAGMSKRTLYQVFASKLALFEALLVDRIMPPAAPPELPGASQEDRLVHLLSEISDFMLQPERTGLIRLIVSDGQASPELMGVFHRLRLMPHFSAVEAWLERERAAGALSVGNVEAAAHFLFGMTVAEPTLLALFRLPRLNHDPTQEQRLRMGVRIFLRGISAVA
jgi:AcrR family transcriptional regulator